MATVQITSNDIFFNQSIQIEGLDTSKLSYEVSRSIGEQFLRILRILEDF